MFCMATSLRTAASYFTIPISCQVHMRFVPAGTSIKSSHLFMGCELYARPGTALADLKPRPGWLEPCLPMEAPLCRTQQTIKYEPAPINCGSKPESPKVGRMSSGTRPRKNCRRRSFGKSPTNLRQLYCPDSFEAG